MVPAILALHASAAESPEPVAGQQSSNSHQQARCLNTGDGYLRARLNGAINIELDWHNNMICEGSARPGGGLRLRFSQPPDNVKYPLVLLFGINGVREGQGGKVLAVNVTIMREGRGEFYSTQGDKCIVDELKQAVIPGAPTKKLSYRVEAHGFCNQPAHALNGNGSVLVTRFDFAGRIDLVSDDSSTTTLASS
jgi:hypothetical protein